MTTAVVPDFSITFNQRRWPCVLDPTLVLSDYGLPLVKQLGEWLELWVVREFWHMIDNPQIYLQQPEQLFSQLYPETSTTLQRHRSQQVIRNLREWENLRVNSDRSTWNIHFLADVIGESLVPPGTDANFIWRWESLAQGLDSYLDQRLSRSETLILAFRDLAALAAARPACILTHRSTEAAQLNDPPAICETLKKWNIVCHEVNARDAIAEAERTYLRNLLVHAGLSKLLWSGLNLVVLHLMVPAAATLSPTPAWDDDLALSELNAALDVELDVELAHGVGLSAMETMNLWDGAKGFWYALP
ncbi:MAG TPA: hypothetical protein V6C88_02865 [Chroococcidiopsis sp.]